MGIYQFKTEDVDAFVRHIGYKARTRGDQVELLSCPYCHSTSDKYSFGINSKTGQFECKRASCGMRGNMITLSRDFGFSLGKDADAYYRTADYSHKQYKQFRDAHRAFESKPAAIAYLTARGISEEVIRKYELTSTDDSTLVFPFKDENGNLTFIKYRNIKFEKGKTPGHKEWCESNCKPILFGMNHCNPSADGGTIIITEGQIDSLSVTMAGYTNAVSVPTGANGFTWVPYCYNFLNQFKRIVVMGDCENGRITLADELATRWTNKVRVCRQEDYKGCKDANELLQKVGILAIKDAIENAAAPYNAHIKPMAKVEQVDIMKIPMIKTGIEALDIALDGGFRLGQLAVLTGKRGEGKSTIASMFGIWALRQDYKSFFYSGELPDFFFRNWMDCQITGKSAQTVSDTDKLNVWYGDKAYIYDETIAEEAEEFESLIQTVETAIIQHDCRFILLDNLMTAMEDDLDKDLYRSQSKFVGELAKLAKRYNVFILLIAHPRKEYSANLTNDSISGSGQITDRADLVLTYARPRADEDPDPNHRRIQITKNRLTGKLREGEDALKVVYDPASRRVTDHTSDMMTVTARLGFSKIEPYENTEYLTIPFE